MARKISKAAVIASLNSNKTPPGLKAGLRRYAKRRGWLK